MTRKIVMQKLKAVLERLAKHESYTQIERSLLVSHGLIGKIKKRINELGQTAEELLALDDLSLHERFYPCNRRTRAEPNWQEVYELSCKPKVTLLTIYEEIYGKDQTGDQPLMAYKTFCQHFGIWKRENGYLERANNLEVVPGEQMQIDYAGMPIHWFDEHGEKHVSQMFVASLPASKFIFALATEKQRRNDWIDGIVAALTYIGGCPKVLVVDNPKTLVNHADRYEAIFPMQIADLCAYYSMTPCACKPAKPREKNRVEAAVNDVERHVIAKLGLRGPIVTKDIRTLNAMILQCCEAFNRREFSRAKGQTRQSLFDAIEKPVLKPLPQQPYEQCEWKCLIVDKMHCVRISSDSGHRYSVPASYIGKEVFVRLSSTTVECFDKENDALLGRHLRHYEQYGNKTHILDEHLTIAEKEIRQPPNYYKNQLVVYGVPPDLANTVMDKIFTRPHLVATRWAHGILHLCRKADSIQIAIQALELAVHYERCSYRYIKDTIATLEIRMENEKQQKNLVFQPTGEEPNYLTPEHPNIRDNYE